MRHRNDSFDTLELSGSKLILILFAQNIDPAFPRAFLNSTHAQNFSENA